MIKRYGIITDSGKKYYVEDHTHLFKHSTWFIFLDDRTYHLLGLRKGYAIDPKNILAKDIKSTKDFIGRHVMFMKHLVEEKDVWGQNINQTSKVSEIIIFQ